MEVLKDYQFDVKWSEDDGEFMATSPDFAGLSAFGETEHEALTEARIALKGFIETYKDNGMKLP